MPDSAGAAWAASGDLPTPPPLPACADMVYSEAKVESFPATFDL